MLQRFSEFCIRRRVLVVSVLGVFTLLMAMAMLRVELRTVFHDLLPVDHPYIKVNDQYNETFGGPNIVAIMVTVKEGDIFRRPILEKIQGISEQMYLVPAVNQFQVISLASRKIRSINSSTYGIESRPIMWPELPEDDAGIQRVRELVLSNPLVYGRYVSLDLKSALITADFLDTMIDRVGYKPIFEKLMKVVAEYDDETVDIRIVGEPILTGWVLHYLPETATIFFITIALIVVVLFITVRSIRGVVLPLTAGAVSAIWALGTASLFGVNFDPLVIVIAFLVTARCISHSVQMLAAWDDRISYGESSSVAAQRTLYYLFRPGTLGVATDAGGVAIVGTMPMPLLQKTAFTGTIWIGSIVITGIILTPVLLSWVRDPHARAFPFDTDKLMDPVLKLCARIVTGVGAYVVLGLTLVVLAISGYFAFQVTVGDARPGSPILWPDHPYNQDAAAINNTFQGSDQMFVVIKGDEENALKDPVLLKNVDAFQRFIEAQPEIGGSVSVADLIGPVNSSLHEGNRRFEELGPNKTVNAELLFMFMQGADPGDIDKYADNKFQDGSVILFFRDHKGDTIRTAVQRLNEYVETHPLPGESKYLLAGGLVGVLAAVNEEIFKSQVESIALALLMLFVFALIAYRSTAAGLFFMPLVIMSNTITFAFMTLNDIGMNINTLPVAALGIGLGVDYALYIADGVKERYSTGIDMRTALEQSLLTAGRGVFITGSTMIVSVLAWYASSLKFQADMGLLIALWLTVSAISSLLLVPAMIWAFKPGFIFQRSADAPHGQPAVA
jgi:uncharacterized protein